MLVYDVWTVIILFSFRKLPEKLFSMSKSSDPQLLHLLVSQLEDVGQGDALLEEESQQLGEVVSLQKLLQLSHLVVGEPNLQFRRHLGSSSSRKDQSVLLC